MRGVAERQLQNRVTPALTNFYRSVEEHKQFLLNRSDPQAGRKRDQADALMDALIAESKRLPSRVAAAIADPTADNEIAISARTQQILIKLKGLFAWGNDNHREQALLDSVKGIYDRVFKELESQ